MFLSELFIQAAGLHQEAVTYQTPFTYVILALPAFLFMSATPLQKGKLQDASKVAQLWGM